MGMSVILPRRRFIAGAVALAASATLGRRARASPFGIRPKAGVAAPRQAAAWGYTTRTLYDDFDTLETIDVKATGRPGYHWYPQNWVGGGDFSPSPGNTPPSWYSIAESVITFVQPTSGPATGWLSSAHYKSSTPGYVGQIFSRGAYFEASIAIDLSLANKKIVEWPAWWSADLKLLTAWRNGSAANVEGIELDFFETFDNPPGLNFTDHDWTWNGAAWPNRDGAKRNVSNSNFGAGQWRDSDFHTFGCLWVPMAANGGTGLLHRYVDDRLSVGTEVTYSRSAGSPAGVFSTLDSGPGQIMMFGSGYNWPIAIDWINVWQA
jgi:hypothetical protein